MIISKEIHHSEKVSPVMCFFTHTTDKWEASSTCIRSIECDISKILTKPPESKCSRVEGMFLKDKYEGHYERDDTLPETSSEYRHKIPKWHEYHMSSFMKYQV